MPHSLFSRLALGFLALISLLCAVYLGITLHASRLYREEVSQSLNRQLARNLIADYGLRVEDGRYDPKAMEGIFHAFMVVNPSIEVYLLDAQGRILTYDAPPGRVKLKRVDLAPVRRFIDARGTTPVTGPDPRDPQREKVFSAAAIGSAQYPSGYLYVVLAGEQYDSVAELFATSFLLRLATYGALASLLLTLLVGLALLGLLTRRLTRLDQAMTAFRDSELTVLNLPAGLDTRSHDEIGRLGRGFIEMAERIRRQVAALRESDRLRRELVANVSHDLRTPVTSIKGYLETLVLKMDRLTAAEQRSYLEIAIRHSERLGRLVEELFELARLESGHTPLQREPFALSELVQDVVQKNRIWADSRRIALQAEIPAGLPLVEADIGLIERALQNLIDNALRHTPAGGAVRVSLEAQPGAVRVHVADTGEGIPADQLPYIFDRFYQVRRSEQDDGHGGSGLGLAITHRILELHHGHIAVSSVPDAGTRFDLELPALA
jgi:two-component system, OmpR family, sensor kinase